jgi:ankyrin repeat protein
MASFEGENIWTAASDGDLERVQYLLEKECVNVNAQDEHGYSPIHAAASHGQLGLLEFLLGKGASVTLRDEDGDTPLLVCDDSACFELLEKHGADVEAKNSDGKGVVDRALDFFEEDNEDMITLLKQRGLIPEDFERTVQEMAEQLQLHGIKIMSDENMAEEDENEEAN